MDSSTHEHEDDQDTPSNPPGEPQETREPEPAGEEPEPPPPEAQEPPADPPAPPAPLPLAEPGVYRCVAEIAGEHAVLGVMIQGREYDYSHERNPQVLQSVAAYVEMGVLEKKG